MNNLELLLERFKKKNIVVFAGAGISMLEPSYAPSWWQIYESAAKSLYERLKEGFPEYDASIPLSDLLGDISTQQLADLIVNEFAGETFVGNLQVVDVADPNENHRLLSALAANDYISAIITTNFDTLIERASAHIGHFFEVSTPSSPVTRFQDKVPLIKIHGSSVDPFHMLETLSQKVRQHKEDFTNPWEDFLRGKDLLVLGYSGADIGFGIGKLFFDTVIRHSNSIFWLKRKGTTLQLIEPFNSKVLFIEDVLPKILRTIARHVNVEDYHTPISKRDAKKALDNQMVEWSKELHITKWSAASFFLTLANRKPKFENINQANLSDFLHDVANQAISRIEPGSSFGIEEAVLPIFLDNMGIYLMGRMELEDARKMFRGSINMFTAMDQMPFTDYHAYKERKINLTGSWNNYGICTILEDHNKSISAFIKALEYGYLAGDIGSFLTPLQNIIHRLNNQQIRKSLFWVETALRMADQEGLIDLSIEYRFLATWLHLERNEIWAAQVVLSEAVPMAKAHRNTRFSHLLNIFQALIFIKQGEFEKGLYLIHNLITKNPKTAILHQAAEELRKLLTTIGICEDNPFDFKFVFPTVEDCLSLINQELERAKQDNKIPWKGQLFRLYETSSVNKQDESFLFALGQWTFEHDIENLVNYSLAQAHHHINQSRFQDAFWNLNNIISMPKGLVSRQNLGFAYNLLGYTLNHLARTNEALLAYQNSKDIFDESEEAYPISLLENIFWHQAHSKNWDEASRWLFLLLDRLTEDQTKLADFVEKVRSLGSESLGLIAKIHDRINSLEEDKSIRNTDYHYRHFYPSRYILGEKENVLHWSLFNQVQALMDQNRIDEGLDLINQLVEKPDIKINEVDLGMIIAFRTVGLYHKSKKPIEDATIALFRSEALSQLNFSALSIVEAAWAQINEFASNPKLEALLFRDRSFITEFSMDCTNRLTYLMRELKLLDSAKYDTWSNFDKYRLSLIDFYNIFDRQTASENENPRKNTSFNLNQFLKELAYNIENSNDETGAINIVAKAYLELRERQLLDFGRAIQIRGLLANFLLQKKEFHRAAHHYKRLSRLSRFSEEPTYLWNSMAGEARSLSRSGNHPAAVKFFEEAIHLAEGTSFQANLLLGLASAYLLESTRVDDGRSLRQESIKIFRKATISSHLGDMSKALARFGLSKALGEDGQQDSAMQEFDKAVAEFTHLGRPEAKILLENRLLYESGNWDSIQLFE